MKKFALLTALMAAASAMASEIPLEYQIGSITTVEITSHNKSNKKKSLIDSDEQDPPKRDYAAEAGKVIQVTKDLVALGESVYTLVKKGKPTSTTEYAAISVVPRDPQTLVAVDHFELENFSLPEEKSYKTVIENAIGLDVIVFEYKVVYSYGGTYNGKGRYLTNVMIVPSKVKTSYGWDFNATMKLSGVLNHGTKASPIAGAMLTLKYTMNSWTSSQERNDTIHVTGLGQVKSFTSK